MSGVAGAVSGVAGAVSGVAGAVSGVAGGLFWHTYLIGIEVAQTPILIKVISSLCTNLYASDFACMWQPPVVTEVRTGPALSYR